MVLAFVLLSKLSTDDSMCCTSKLRPTRSVTSQRKFAERATKWQNDTNIDFKVAAAHYFAKKA